MEIKTKAVELYKKLAKFRQETEVYSRVTGYLRPVKQWNDAKASEFKDRITFKNK